MSKRLYSDILADLSKPVPRRLLKSKKMGGANIVFIPWYRVSKLMSHYTNGHWSYEVKEKLLTSSNILMTVTVTIYAEDGSFSMDGTGIESLSAKGYGDPQSNAESMAFRRACAKFGLGLDLYEGDL